MFNKKLKNELNQYKEAYSEKHKLCIELQDKLKIREAEIERLKQFDKIIEEKIKELCAPRITAFFDATASGFCTSNFGDNLLKGINALKADNIEQGIQIAKLQKEASANEKVFLLVAKIEELLKKQK